MHERRWIERSSLDLLAELADNVTLYLVLADVEMGQLSTSRQSCVAMGEIERTHAKVGTEDAAALRDRAADLGRCLPHHLGKVRRNWVVRVVLGCKWEQSARVLEPHAAEAARTDFICPRFDRASNCVAVALCYRLVSASLRSLV
jgi:hypothetical protein